jgi:hypothetical protein
MRTVLLKEELVKKREDTYVVKVIVLMSLENHNQVYLIEIKQKVPI